MKIFFNLSNMPEIIGQYNFFPKMPKIISGVSKFSLSAKEKNWAAMNLKKKLYLPDLPNCPKFLKHPGKNFCESFQASGIFQVP
jgi:hypothetical protein